MLAQNIKEHAARKLLDHENKGIAPSFRDIMFEELKEQYMARIEVVVDAIEEFGYIGIHTAESDIYNVCTCSEYEYHRSLE